MVDRKLSAHVISRFYRAPEVILMEKNYGFAIDMWSTGCIFAELLRQLKKADKKREHFILFGGTSSCFPLSPGEKSKALEGDQMSKIMNHLSPLNEDDTSFITDD